MAGDQFVLIWSSLISKPHVAWHVIIVVFVCVGSGPDTGVASPDEIFIADQIILAREQRINIVALFDLIIIKLLEISAHTHGSNGITRIEAI